MNKIDSNTRSFNARYMTFKQVAESFIKTDDFEKIIKNNHTVLMGSRGCGKTTLLKMLHPDAIVEWEKCNTRPLFDEMPFYGIYIPTDRQWNKQVEVFEKDFKSNKKFTYDITQGLINLNILIALCDTFRSLIQIGTKQDDNLHEYDIALAQELIELWKIPTPIVPNLYSISQRFYSYVDDLNVIVQRSDTHAKLGDFCYWDFVNKVEIAINAFEERFRNIDFFKNKPFKWALCFDELEIAPQWLYTRLMNDELRSRNQKILFKLTTIPTISMAKATGTLSSRNLDDYEIVKLWVYDSRSQSNWRNFCESYLQKVLFTKYHTNVSTKSLFGELDYNKALRESDKSVFSQLSTAENSEFEEGGIMWYVMKELSQIDKSFYMYLNKKHINPLNPTPINKGQIDQVHRKIKPIVLYRYYFKRSDDQPKKRRSRKVVSFNHGRNYIYDIADGNPRAFVNLINDFLPNVNLNKKSGQPQTIPINKQATIINDFCTNYFYPRIAYYPDSVIKFNNKTITLEKLINEIGIFFQKQYVENDFKQDPYSLIQYDDKCPVEIEKIFNKGLESGGILLIEEEERDNKVRGVRKKTKVYRLSYSLYPYFNLPQRTYSVRDLSGILAPLLIADKIEYPQLPLQF